uniref:MOB kinase activator 1B n=1 Tax=Pelusios castaneus TaxID=367368 RepID=A0A8C8RRI9_9SAUR
MCLSSYLFFSPSHSYKIETKPCIHILTTVVTLGGREETLLFHKNRTEGKAHRYVWYVFKGLNYVNGICVTSVFPLNDLLYDVFPFFVFQPRYEYHWADGTNIKKPIKCSAPKYIDYLMTWVQDQLDDETLFPSKIGVPFPKNFMSVAKTILKRLFRVYAHIYHQHFDPVIQLQEEAHLNTSFKHFIFFVQEFNLIDRRELAPLQELIEKLTSKDR